MKILIGNLFESKMQTKVNTVNCVGIMGKGIALEFKRKYPEMFKEYVTLCKSGLIRPGKPYYYENLFGDSVLNFPTKDHWRASSRLSYIIDGLKWFEQNYEKLGISSIAFPPLGCGNGGLTWDIIGPVMYDFLKKLPIDIEIYAPFGTSAEKLTTEFLEKNLIQQSSDILGIKQKSFKPEWLLLLETVQQLSTNRYTLAIGRTMFQKIAYILTLSGISTGFSFKKWTYGPYCEEVKQALTAFANANLITESQIGKMIKIEVTPEYLKMNCHYSAEELQTVKKTVDLFSRVKNTSQAELFTTIIFAYHELLKGNSPITETSIYQYIIDWKPHWKSDNEKNKFLIDEIRNLALLQWISPCYDHGLLKPFDE